MEPDVEFIKAKIRIHLKQSLWIYYFSVVIDVLFCCSLYYICNYVHSWKKSIWSVTENPTKDLIFYFLHYVFSEWSLTWRENTINVFHVICLILSSCYKTKVKMSVIAILKLPVYAMWMGSWVCKRKYRSKRVNAKWDDYDSDEQQNCC